MATGGRAVSRAAVTTRVFVVISHRFSAVQVIQQYGGTPGSSCFSAMCLVEDMRKTRDVRPGWLGDSTVSA